LTHNWAYRQERPELWAINPRKNTCWRSGTATTEWGGDSKANSWTSSVRLKVQIPIRTDPRDIDRPGFLEADTVAHCGTSRAGGFSWSTTFTDIFSPWPGNRAVWNKGSADGLREVKDLEKGLPFALPGFDADHGSEFLTFHLWRYWLARPRPISMTRSRADRKNDQAHVEQKNWTHVRQLLGYQRPAQPELIPRINAFYRTWAPFQNCFRPTLKLLRKTRKGSKTLRQYSKPQTPYQRLLQSSHLSQEQKEALRVQYPQLNPLELKGQIEQKPKVVFNNARAW